MVSFCAFTAQAQIDSTARPQPTPVTAGATAPARPLSTPAQVSGNYGSYLYQRYANDKEARAVVHLFSRKKTGGGLWLGVGAAVIGVIASQTGTTTTSSGTTTFEVTPLGYGLLVGLFGGVGIGKLARFSNEKLYQTLLGYEQQKGLPEYVSRRIKDKDYRQPATSPGAPAAPPAK